jgi:hypothetical protein
MSRIGTSHIIAKRFVEAVEKGEGRIIMTCREFRRCSNYQLGNYECDHIGKPCQKGILIKNDNQK